MASGEGDGRDPPHAVAARETPLLGLLRATDLARAAGVCRAWRAPAAGRLRRVPLLRARPLETWGGVEPDDEDEFYATPEVGDCAWLHSVPESVLNERWGGSTALVEVLCDRLLENGCRKLLGMGDSYHERQLVSAALALLDVPAVDVDATLNVEELSKYALVGSRPWDVHIYGIRCCLFTADKMAPVHALPWVRAFYDDEPEFEQKLREALERRGADFSAVDANGLTEADLAPFASQVATDLVNFDLSVNIVSGRYFPKTPEDLPWARATIERLDAFAVDPEGPSLMSRICRR